MKPKNKLEGYFIKKYNERMRLSNQIEKEN
jgi:hypothetical protein